MMDMDDKLIGFLYAVVGAAIALLVGVGKAILGAKRSFTPSVVGVN